MVRILISFFIWVIWIGWYENDNPRKRRPRRPKTRNANTKPMTPFFLSLILYLSNTNWIPRQIIAISAICYCLCSLIFFNNTGLLNVYLPIWLDRLQSVFSFKTRPAHIPANEITNTAPSSVTHGVILQRKSKTANSLPKHALSVWPGWRLIEILYDRDLHVVMLDVAKQP